MTREQVTAETFAQLLIDYWRMFNLLPPEFVREFVTPLVQVKGSFILRKRVQEGLRPFDYAMLLKIQNLHTAAVETGQLRYCRVWQVVSGSLDEEQENPPRIPVEELHLTYAVHAFKAFAVIQFSASDGFAALAPKIWQQAEQRLKPTPPVTVGEPQ